LKNTDLTFFLFGTLRDKDLLDLVAGTTDYTVQTAQLEGYETLTASGHAFPLIVPKIGSVASGLFLSGLSQVAYDRITFFEEVYDYWTSQLTVMVCGNELISNIFFPPKDAFVGDDCWDLNVWQHTSKAAAISEAEEIMSLYVGQTPYNMPVHKHGTMMRAKSRVRATERFAPVHLRQGFNRDDVHVTDIKRPYAGYFAMEDWDFTHTNFDGSQSETMKRTVFGTADAVTVLPYDPVTDQVVLIEQFRAGAWSRGDPHPWVLEIVAGRCDGTETPEEVAVKEVQEEAGLMVRALEHICDCYPTPGGSAEYFYNYLAIVDLAGAQGGLHGLASEGEDIKSHVLGFDGLMDTLKTGEADCGPLWLSALWLAAERTRLRETWCSA
jgi:nudix-type nucleoside diphosphatase (YffH/AdpP family)